MRRDLKEVTGRVSRENLKKGQLELEQVSSQSMVVRMKMTPIGPEGGTLRRCGPVGVGVA